MNTLLQTLTKSKVSQVISHPLALQMARYSMVGGLSSLVNYTVVILLVGSIQINPLAANIVGFWLGFIFSFNGHRLWTFPENTGNIKSTLPFFVASNSLNFFMNETLLYQLLNNLHLPCNIAMLIDLLIISCTMFSINKLFVFRTSRSI